MNKNFKDESSKAIARQVDLSVKKMKENSKSKKKVNKEVKLVDPLKSKKKNNIKFRKFNKSKKSNNSNAKPVKVIPLGGLGEIGKNMTVIEYDNDIVIIDCGFAFPEDDMPGIDMVIPDFNYVVQNKDKVKGIFITHGHEDHIGSLSYLLKEINIPIFATRLSAGLIEGKLKEAGVLDNAKINVQKAGDIIKLGQISMEFIQVNHSIPDSCGFAIITPAGVIVHTGDFKIDFTPVDGQMINLARFGELGSNGVLALLIDSTNAERPGSTPSESKVGKTFDFLFDKAGSRRVIAATFSSNVHRIQQFISSAEKFNRKVAFSGRSMEYVTSKAIEMGYLKAKPGTIIELSEMNKYSDDMIAICTTGSQGEPMSALTRMASGDHNKIKITQNDYIIISASPIPGNEKTVDKVINELMKIGAYVVYESSAGLHVSGHACQDDIKIIIGLTKPKYFIPVHGELKHLYKNRETALEMGIPKQNICVAEIGDVIELTNDKMINMNKVQAGAIMVDGSGVGDVGNIVLKDRRLLSDEGLFVVVLAIDNKTGKILSGPDIVSRGFVYMRESEELINGAIDVCNYAINELDMQNYDRNNLKQVLKDRISAYLFNKTKRKPVVLPIIQEINMV